MSIHPDALRNIQDTAVKANGVRWFQVPAEPKHVYHLINADGSTTTVNADQQPHSHKVFDFDTLAIRLAQANKEKNDICCWYSTNIGVTAILSEDYRDRAVLNLTHSDPLAKLVEWKKDKDGVMVGHKATVLMVRNLFRGMLANYDDVVEKIRKIDIKKVQNLNAEQGKSKVSLDKDIMIESAGAEKLPDTLKFTVPFFAEAISTVKVTIEVAFSLDVELGEFRFYVLPGEVEKAIFDAEVYLQNSVLAALSRIAIDDKPASNVASTEAAKSVPLSTVCPIYCGNP